MNQFIMICLANAKIMLLSHVLDLQNIKTCKRFYLQGNQQNLTKLFYKISKDRFISSCKQDQRKSLPFYKKNIKSKTNQQRSK
ncbi:hypothetical protein TTHERM_000886969 (macronuclear) [Tetrahymena thermophila SB210]|uniref:Transmembrane protein n=1 Tax=Tetrahymena thermophila (strain SB210) TaxID=312017 RepID=W7XKK5_TETTS|nr:hypothetical protein TTHERM_000886969 [Tetrahymena thermophila SB210]EWS76616.1 hypothetical protein TTHERM_000886969 [Tetrahymena thermophila SB210]|eukprot:XP_012650902.1 hypothetical protein TTHERM_000886969 [Tetrahymena thermophila SB210]